MARSRNCLFHSWFLPLPFSLGLSKDRHFIESTVCFNNLSLEETTHSQAGKTHSLESFLCDGGGGRNHIRRQMAMSVADNRENQLPSCIVVHCALTGDQ